MISAAMSALFFALNFFFAAIKNAPVITDWGG